MTQRTTPWLGSREQAHVLVMMVVLMALYIFSFLLLLNSSSVQEVFMDVHDEIVIEAGHSTEIITESATKQVATSHHDLGSCPKASSIVLSVKPGGRLGNQVFEYLSVYSLSQLIPGAWPAIPREILLNLGKVFVNLTLPCLEDVALRCKKLYLLSEYRNVPNEGNLQMTQELVSKQHTARRTAVLVIPRYITEVNNTLDLWPQLHAQVQFLPKLISRSQVQLRKHLATVKRKLRAKESETLDFVGVHVRRTDFSKHYKARKPTWRPADEKFFLKAMIEMRKQLKPRRAVFVVVSDDRKWCESHLAAAPDVVIAGSGNIKDPGPDLALLAACNHTVLAYGTYGLTGALHNARGRAIVYQFTKDRNAAIVFAERLNWTVMVVPPIRQKPLKRVTAP